MKNPVAWGYYMYYYYVLSCVQGSVANNNGFWTGWLDLLTPSLQLLLITFNYNSSQSMTASDSLRSLLDYECLLFRCDWLGSDLRATHFWVTNELRIPNDDSPELTDYWNLLSVLTCLAFVTSGRTVYKSPPPTITLLLCAYSLLRKRV
jgi:hypothetical protein